MLKKILLGLAILVILGFAAYKWFVSSAPPIPAEIEDVIVEVLNEEVPEFVTGNAGYAENDGVKIWYEAISKADSTKGTVLLVMGHSGTGLMWPYYFVDALVDEGYQVIRYDNRGLGNSDWLPNWSAENAYDLEDMAKDGIAVLDAVGVEKAHMLGISMGGMIVQSIGINHPERVLTLTPIMSSGFMTDPALPPPPNKFIADMAKYALKYGIASDEPNRIRMSVAIDQMLMGDGGYKSNLKYLAQRTLYELRNRKGFNIAVGDQHTKAIEKSGSRYEDLKNLDFPTLVIHGKSDPLVLFEHAEKYAPMIPNAKTLWIDGMGHDLPEVYMDQYMPAIFENFSLAEVKVITEKVADDM